MDDGLIQHRNSKWRALIILGLFFCNISSYCQSIKDKKVEDLDFFNDLSILESMGIDRVDIEFMEYMSANENKNLTVSNYMKNMNKYRQMPDYKLIKNMWLNKAPKLFENPFPDSLSVQYDYEKGQRIATSENKVALIIFAAYHGVNAYQLQNAIFHNAFNNIHKKYVIIWLYVDAPQHEKTSKNLDLEESVYKKNSQPYSVLLKNGKVIDEYDGFSILDLNEYRKFLKN